ncbi:MAG: MG2 domain-containing protein, partial [Akkermansiaceae bacterium]
HGYIIAGEFRRGGHRGGGQYADCTERDRVRAIQLFLQAHENQPDKVVRARTLLNLAAAISMGRQGNNAWRFQTLTNLDKLPEQEPGNRWHRGGRNPRGAPVTTDGKALLYQIPASWEAARNDGERWRYAITEVARLDPTFRDHCLLIWADFLHAQFGVKTMAQFGWFRSMDMDDQKGILQLHTLTDEETVARLANGVRRFKLPAGFNFMSIYRELSKRNEHAADKLIQIYLDRRQHGKSAKLLEETITRFPISRLLKNRKNLLSQITGNWGRFNATSNAFPAGTEPELVFTYRNAGAVTLTAREVDINGMVDDLWQYIERNPLKLDYNLYHFHSLGRDLVNGERKKYVGKEVGRRTHTLKPRANHWDTNASVTVPVSKAGTYLVSAKLENGVTTHTVVWIDGISLVKKEVKGGELLYVADALTGKPLASAKVEFFGYHTMRREKPGLLKKYDFISERVTKYTDTNGTLFIKNGELDQKHQWMTRATSGQGTALLGVNRMYSHVHEQSGPGGQKSFGITDRPVYQPGQKVFGKFWVRQARYDLGDASTHAGKEFTVRITDATGGEVLKDLQVRADAYGGVEYEHELGEDAKLGNYSVTLRMGNRWHGSHHFRVEEYKKPEYEVTVEAPTDPVRLGESFKAIVKATYYHGAPVANAKVVVKIMRQRHNELWFPYGPWDWLYGGGYGWLDVDRPWYPGWKRWGCVCPPPFWWPRGGEQPEIVLEQELDIRPDGTVEIEVDSTLAKQVHGDTDHRYEITAEV